MANPVYPVKISASGRYLVDQNNAPFLLAGDAPQALVVNLSVTNAAFYLADRATNGFNTLWVNLLCNTYTKGRADGSLLNGILPFTTLIPSTTNYNLTTPNEAYFAYVDQLVRMAATNGIQVMLDPIETGGWLTTMLDNGMINCRTYGQYLGNRYKNFPNIIWVSGNDFQNWSDPNNDAVVTAVALGIMDKDTNHLQTVELNYYVSSSLDDANWAPIIGLNAAYTYYPTYDEVLHAYRQSTNRPVFVAEANYEFEGLFGPVTTAPILRKQEYWTLLSGGAGQVYGNHYTWQFLSGWQSYLDTPGATEMAHATALFAPRAWYNLVPDTNHTVVTAGFGTYSGSGYVADNNYMTAARTADGSLVMAYTPVLGQFTVDMSKLSGPAVAQWYDPGSGTYVPISGSPFTNSGTHNFSPPGNNADGDGGWVLVLETSPPPLPNTITIAFTNGGFVINFNTVLGQIYALQSTTNLAGGPWSSIVTNITGTGGSVQISDTNAVNKGQRYYRLNWTQAPTGYTITASAVTTNGTINPSGTFVANAGTNLIFTATPKANYAVKQWLLDGSVVQTNGTSYTLNHIQASHSVQVTFYNILIGGVNPIFDNIRAGIDSQVTLNQPSTTISTPQNANVARPGISDTYSVVAVVLWAGKT